MKNQVVTGILIALFSGSLGFGFSQLTFGGDVKQHNVEIIALKEADTMIRKDMADERNRTDDRIKNVALLMTKLIEQNQELINLVKVQNELLNRRPPHPPLQNTER